MKSKNLPATGRIIRLLEHVSGYSFNLYYVKGKDMILCDYLSRIEIQVKLYLYHSMPLHNIDWPLTI